MSNLLQPVHTRPRSLRRAGLSLLLLLMVVAGLALPLRPKTGVPVHASAADPLNPPWSSNGDGPADGMGWGDYAGDPDVLVAKHGGKGEWPNLPMPNAALAGSSLFDTTPLTVTLARRSTGDAAFRSQDPGGGTNTGQNMVDVPTLAGGCANLLQDPGFEAYTPNPYWGESSTNFGTPLCTTGDCGTGGGTAGPRTGSVWAWFGGTDMDETGSLTQTVIIPTGTATLAFYFWLGGASLGSGTDDTFSAQMDSVTLFTANATQVASYLGYTFVTVDVSAFADGGMHEVRFTSTTSDQVVNFNLDDVILCSDTDPFTVLFDPFEDATLAEYVDGTMDYVDGPPGFGRAADFTQGNWIRYAVPGWYQWTSTYNPIGKQGTVEFWVYPKKYDVTLVRFNWYRTTSSPSAGHILGITINAEGKLATGIWAAVTGLPFTPLPEGTTTIPLDQWTHVALTWGDGGTRLYVNGELDAATSDNMYPALNPTVYVYVPSWGSLDMGYIDELRISKIAKPPASTSTAIPTLTPTAPPTPTWIDTPTPASLASMPASINLSWLSIETDPTTGVAWGDVDGDGDLDLAVGSYGGPNRLYLNDDETLASNAAWSSAEADFTTSLAWGDYDNDGDLDLVAGNHGNPIRLYRNDGGVLTPDATWSSVEADWTLSVAWGDVDGDGDLDLAVGNSWQPNRLYRNDGGTLTPGAVWSSAEADGTNTIAWGDVDGDGDLDLAVGNLWQPNRLYRNDGGVLTTGSVWLSGEIDDTESAAWGDVDDDGDLDLAVGNVWESNRLYRNDGGTLIPSAVWSSSEADSSESVAWGDYDGDDDLDLIVGNWDWDVPNQLYRNDGGMLTSSPVWSSIGGDLTHSVAWGDYDGDGDLDLAMGSYEGSDRVYRNDGAALMTNALWSSAENDGTGSVDWGDCDGDGDLDLAVGNGGPNRLYRNDGGTLTTSSIWSSDETNGTQSMAWGDVDGDGDLDLAVGNGIAMWGTGEGFSNQLYRNDGGMLTSSAVWSSVETDSTQSVAWGDYDGDGDLDLAVGNDGRPNRLYRNDGGTLTTGAVWSSVDDSRTTSVAWGDYDGDGDLDLAAGNFGQPNLLHRNDGGVLTSDAVWLSVETDSTLGVAWGDVDGDGDLDLAAGNDWQFNRLYHNDGGELTSSAVWSSAEADSTQSVAWGDYDGDGDLDLAAGNYWQSNRLYRNDSGTLVSSAVWSSAEDDLTSSVAWGDVDGDGDLDLAVGNSGDFPDRPVRLYRNTRDARSLPGAVPRVSVTRPGPDADFYSDPDIWTGPTIPITYTLFYPQGSPVEFIRAWYSPDGSGRWLPAVAASGTVTTNLSTAAPVTRTYTNPTPVAILDLATVTSTLPLTPTDTIADIDVTLNLTHTWDGDLVITLTAPSGRPVLLVDRRGSSGDNFTGAVLDDEAPTSIISGTAPFTGRYRPEQALSRFDGSSPQGTWTLSITDVATGDTGTLLSWGMTVTLNSGAATHVYYWDVGQSGFFGQSDNVVFRIEAVPAVVNIPDGVPGPYLYGAYASDTFPFRVRGTQVRVLSGTVPISNAVVYRLPAGQTAGGALLADSAGSPFHTDGQGYLQGRGEIGFGDQLLALAPVTATESYVLYYTNGVPTVTGLDTYTVTQAGVQTLTVSADHPLLLFDLHVSLEWDAHNDPVYLQQLEFDLRRASQYLYDFTDGQVALGQVTVHQNGDYWIPSHVAVRATNRMRPLAVQGGIVLTTTVDPEHADVVYDIGQVHVGATWNRYGAPGYTPSGDWPLALAHELSHYFLFQEDVYLGLNEGGLLIPVDTCTGSAMGDMYDPDNTELVYDTSHWSANCADTLANRTLNRTEWETIRLWYPDLITPTIVNPGPSLMPFEFTAVTVLDPITPTAVLADPTFYLDYVGGEVASSEARAFLLREEYPDRPGYDYVIDLGNPLGGQNRVLARGAQPGDRLCVFDAPRRQYGCEVIASGDERVDLEQDESWTPLVQVSPVTSQTIHVEVGGLPPTLTLHARLYPKYGFGSDVITLACTGGVYSGTFDLPWPALMGHVQVWVEETATENNPRREAIVTYAIGGNPGIDRGGWPASRFAWPASRFAWPASRFAWPGLRGSWAPIVSPDGQMIFFTEDPAVFEEGELYTVQSMAGLPSLPDGKVATGQGYSLVASPNVTQAITGSISFQYLSVDVLVEGVDEEELTIHFWGGSGWQALETVRAPYYNLASAPSQGSGVYALLAGVTTPHVTSVAPAAAVNEATTTLTIGGGYFLEPVEVALVGPTATYTLPVLSVSPVSITAVVSQGLPAREYQVVVVNRNEPGGPAVSPVPGTFALYEPADACFYDFFESGAGKWERGGEWDLVILPSGERALTDSPAGNYDSAIPPAVAYTTYITSAAFSLDGCTNPVLTFRHDYVIAQVGASRDVGRVEISTDGGATWTELASYSGGGTYGGQGSGILDVPSQEWNDVDWKDVQIDLGAHTGVVRLRFSLEVDQYVSDKGWVIDDVVVHSGGGPGTDADIFLPLVLKDD